MGFPHENEWLYSTDPTYQKVAETIYTNHYATLGTIKRLLPADMTDTSLLVAVEQQGNTLLHHAVLSVTKNINPSPLELGIFEYILDFDDPTSRSSLFTQNSSGETPLWIAAESGALEIVKALLEAMEENQLVRGALDNRFGETPCFVALRQGAFDVAETLYCSDLILENIEHRDKMEQTLLHAAVQGQDEDCISLFAERIAQAGLINSKDKNGNTALHLAKNSSTAEILFEYGADDTIQNDQGEYPRFSKRDCLDERPAQRRRLR